MTASVATINLRQTPADAPGPSQLPLSFNRIVSRHLVHRSSVAEVLLTDWRSTGDNTYLCAAQWPRGHSLYRVLNGHHDPLLIAETVRQTGILLAHSGEDVPLDWKFVMDRMTISVNSDGLRTMPAPANIVIEAALVHLRRSTSSAVHLRLDARFLREGLPFGTAAVRMRCVSPTLYRRLRGDRTPTTVDSTVALLPADPHLVGMNTEADVVLGAALGVEACQVPSVGSWPLRVRTEHPVLFDHPQDHVPGMLVFEGLRQAGRALLGWPDAQLADCDINFARYLELDRPSIVIANMLRQITPTEVALEMVVSQDDQTAVAGTVQMRRIQHHAVTRAA